MTINPVTHIYILISMNVLMLGVMSLNRLAFFTAHQLFWLGNIVATGVVCVSLTILFATKCYKKSPSITSLYFKAIVYAFFLVFVISISYIFHVNTNEFEKILLGFWLIVFSGFSEDLNVNSGARFIGGLLMGIGLIDLAQLLPAGLWNGVMYSGIIIIGTTFIYYILLIFIIRRKNLKNVGDREHR